MRRCAAILVTVWAAVFAVIAAGCSAPRDDATAQQIAIDYLVAIDDGDVDRACDLSTSARRDTRDLCVARLTEQAQGRKRKTYRQRPVAHRVEGWDMGAKAVVIETFTPQQNRDDLGSIWWVVGLGDDGARLVVDDLVPVMPNPAEGTAGELLDSN